MGHKNRPLPPHLAGGLGRRHNSFSIVSNLITLPPVQCNTTLCNAALWGKGLSSDAIMATYCQPGTRLPRVDFQPSWEFILFISIENENQHVWEVGDFNNTQGDQKLNVWNDACPFWHNFCISLQQYHIWNLDNSNIWGRYITSSFLQMIPLLIEGHWNKIGWVEKV